MCVTDSVFGAVSGFYVQGIGEGMVEGPEWCVGLGFDDIHLSHRAILPLVRPGTLGSVPGGDEDTDPVEMCRTGSTVRLSVEGGPEGRVQREGCKDGRGPQIRRGRVTTTFMKIRLVFLTTETEKFIFGCLRKPLGDQKETPLNVLVLVKNLFFSFVRAPDYLCEREVVGRRVDLAEHGCLPRGPEEVG